MIVKMHANRLQKPENNTFVAISNRSIKSKFIHPPENSFVNITDINNSPKSTNNVPNKFRKTLPFESRNL